MPVRNLARVKEALRRLRWWLEDPDGLVGYINDPPLATGPVAWARVWPGVTVFVELPKVTVFRDWFGDQCPECQRVHFPWCGDESAEQRAAADDGC